MREGEDSTSNPQPARSRRSGGAPRTGDGGPPAASNARGTQRPGPVASPWCGITGVYNRSAFERHLQGILYRDFSSAAGTAAASHVLAVLDIDEFCVVNHRFGRRAGDDILGAVADILADHMPGGTALVARTGADEFAVLLEHHSLARARSRCQLAMQAVAQHDFEWAGRSVRLTLSAGLASIVDGERSVSELMSDADHARREASSECHGSIHCSDAHREPHPRERPTDLTLAAELLTALETDHLALWYQPILPVRQTLDNASSSARTNAPPRHYELLLRMRRGDQIIGPQPSLRAAEKHQLISEVDRWVLRTAADWLTRRPYWQVRRETCCINVSARSICDRRFVEDACEILLSLGPLARSICFELTETTPVTHLDRARGAMERMLASGCTFALDDFGSGEASLPYLHHLPARYMKIAGHLVRRAAQGGDAMRLLDLVNQIGHNAGKLTVAEHVEAGPDLAMVGDLGIDFAQGHHVGRPKPISAFGMMPPRSERATATIIPLRIPKR